MTPAQYMPMIFAIIILVPLFGTFAYVLFKKDEGEQYSAAYLIGLKWKMWFTFDKDKREALKDELWVKSNKEATLKQNAEAVSDLGVDYSDDEELAMVLKREKELAKAAKAKAKPAAKKTTAKKAPAKKPAAKKPAAKKTAAKKPAAKKTTAKKAPAKKTAAKKTTKK